MTMFMKNFILLNPERGTGVKVISWLILDGNKSSFECIYDDCGKIFTDKGSFRKHLLTHGEKQVLIIFLNNKYLCRYVGCNKKFLDNSKLRRHILVHTVNLSFR